MATNNPQTTPTVFLTLVSGVVLIVLTLIAVSLAFSADFLSSLRDREYARGLITFLVSLAAILLGIVIVIGAFFLPADDVKEERFRRAREVFVAMMGVLGTIVGFYFGTSGTSQPELELSSVQVVDLPESKKQLSAFISGGSPPYAYSVSFDDESVPAVAEVRSLEGWVVEKFTSIKPVGITIDVRDGKGRKTTGRFRPPDENDDVDPALSKTEAEN